MTDLNPHPLIVSLVQVAANFSMFLFAIPAGALADIFDRRRLMIVIQIAVTVLGFGFAFLVRLGGATPNVLLGFVRAALHTGTLSSSCFYCAMARDRHFQYWHLDAEQRQPYRSAS